MTFKHKFSKPIFLPGSDIGHFKKRPPKLLREKAKGQTIQFTFPAQEGAEEWKVERRVGEFVEFSYNTADRRVLSRRAIVGNQKYIDFCDSLSRDNISLDDTMINSYARRVYELSLQEYTDSTGLPSIQKTHSAYMNIEHSRVGKLEPIWKQWQHQCGIFDISNELYAESYAADDFSFEAMNYRVGFLINWWLQENDISISVDDRTRLVKATDAYAHSVLHGSTIRVSESHVEASVKTRLGQPTTKLWTLTDLIEHWAARPDTDIRTARKFKSMIAELVNFLGHEIADDVTRVEMQAWSDHLVSLGKATNTINSTYITATKLVFNYGNKFGFIEKNPAVILSPVKNAKKLPAREPYTSDEVVTIINSARKNTAHDLRWIPQLAASLGSRVIEVAQIHASQVKKDRKHPHIWTVEIKCIEDGQSLKNEDSTRVVPLHPDLFDKDFHDFVISRKGRFLFSDKKFNPHAKSKHFEYVGNRIRIWIKTLDIDHVNKGTTHSFRHWFETESMKQRLDIDLMKYIQGHKRDFSHANYRRFPGQDECLNLIKALFSGLDIDKAPSSTE